MAGERLAAMEARQGEPAVERVQSSRVRMLFGPVESGPQL